MATIRTALAGCVVWLMLLPGGAMAAGEAESRIHSKKLIEYGWDTPDTAYVRAHIGEMEKRPFDGLIFHLPRWPQSSNVFTPVRMNEADFAGAYDDCRNIRWGRFTDNFLVMLAAADMDWFSDRDWDAIRHNVGIVAKAAALGHCRGICFDPEPYGKNPWQYSTQAHAKTRSFAEYQVKVRQRGAEFMRAVSQQVPQPVIHTFFLLSYFDRFLDEPDPEKRDGTLSHDGYSLLPAFLNGMLDAAGPDAVITDGNENSYYYTSPLPFYQAYHTVRQRALSFIAPESRRKYETQVKLSQALYVDYLFGLGRWGENDQTPARGLDPEQRQQWFEHNTYYALKTTDEFVWLYSENMNWWMGTAIPPGLEEAVRSARAKIEARQPLGFDIADTIKAAQEKRHAELLSRMLRRTAAISRVGPGDRPPVIDGKLDDAIWQRVPSLEPFVPYVGVSQKVAAQTTAHVAYDDRKLYVAVRCDEPDPAAIQVVGENRDDPVWEGDSIDIFLSRTEAPVPYVHLIVNPANIHWDSLFTTGDDLTFNPAWETATARDTKGWTLEAAIPWKEIPPPAPGQRLRANICRQRIPGMEQTCWSQTIAGFPEPENFGVWNFR